MPVYFRYPGHDLFVRVFILCVFSTIGCVQIVGDYWFCCFQRWKILGSWITKNGMICFALCRDFKNLSIIYGIMERFNTIKKFRDTMIIYLCPDLRELKLKKKTQTKRNSSSSVNVSFLIHAAYLVSCSDGKKISIFSEILLFCYHDLEMS